MICTNYDGFNGDTTFWIATLNDGTEVFQDDNRPGLEINSSWLRLQKYCSENNKYVTGFRIQFRDHIEHLPENAEGYFFSLGLLAGFFSTKQWYLFITGYKDGDVVRIKKWKVPEIIVESEETREFEKCKDNMILKLN